MATESSFIERLYTHFLGRDICYLFSGGLFFCIAEYVFLGEIILPTGLSLEVIGFLMISYFLGISISNFASLIIFRGLIIPKGYSHDLIFNQDLVKYYHGSVLNLYERHVFMHNIELTVGFSSLLGGLLVIIFSFIMNINTNRENILLGCFLLIYGIFMINESKKFYHVINFAREKLAEDIAAKKN